MKKLRIYFFLFAVIMFFANINAQCQFSTGNMGKFIRVGNNFQYLPFANLHYTINCDSIKLPNSKTITANSIFLNADTSKVFMKSQGNYFTHYVGELYGGGIVVAVWKTSGVEHGLIASLIDLSSSLAWSANTTTLSNSSSIYDGQANTTAMLNGGDVSKAGYICDTATTGGYSDWYLPSVTEFLQYRDNVGILYTTTSTLSGAYWTSTESEATKSLLINTQLGTAAAVNKASGYKVRAFRKY